MGKTGPEQSEAGTLADEKVSDAETTMGLEDGESEDESILNEASPNALSRRQLFGWTGLTVGLTALRSEANPDQQPPANVRINRVKVTPAVQPPVERITRDKITKIPQIRRVRNYFANALRPDDLLNIEFEFVNLAPANGPRRLVRVDANKSAFIIAHFDSQNIAEKAYYEQDETPENPPIPALSAGESRLVYVVPPGAEIPFTLEALLTAMREYPLSVPDTARTPQWPIPPAIRFIGKTKRAFSEIRVSRMEAVRIQRQISPGNPTIIQGVQAIRPLSIDRIRAVIRPGILLRSTPYEPDETETAIELPFRLIIAPNGNAAFLHSLAPVTHNNKTELWHTRLGVRTTVDGKLVVVESPEGAHQKTMRAVWSPDYNKDAAPAHSNAPFRMTLDIRDRHELVGLMADFTKPGADTRFMDVERLMLSSLGGWLDSRYAAPRIAGFDIEAWRHIATMGRDQYVRVIYAGYLLPFGHRASLIKVTERKFYPAVGGVPRAYLFQRMFIVVREPEKSYPGNETVQGRKIPLKSVRITSLITPDLNDPAAAPSSIAGMGMAAFWPHVSGQPFLFKMVATDAEGQTTDFSAPLVFVLATTAENAAKMTTVRNAYNQSGPDRRERNFGGQKVAFADAKSSGDTTFQTASMTFGVEAQAGPIPAFPVMVSANTILPAVQQITRSQTAVAIALDDTYIQQGFNPSVNAGQVFLSTLNLPKLTFPNDSAGAFANPNMAISAISRLVGPVSGGLQEIDGVAGKTKKFIGDMQKGNFNPLDYFKDILEAKILGGLTLKDVLAAAGLTETPQLLNREMKTVGNTLQEVNKALNEVPDTLVATMDWNTTKLQSFIVFKPLGGCKLAMHAEITQKIPKSASPPPPPTFLMRSSMVNFQVNFFEFIILTFDKLEFIAQSGKKADVNADMNPTEPVKFGGPLEFVNKLKDLIPSSGFSDPPYLDISPSGITAGFSLEIPPVSVGVFNLRNITLGAALTLPFTGDAVRFRFNFCEKERPFTLTISLFGGGGFFAIGLGIEGVERIEAALEFGAAFEIDFGVASGGVSVMAGVYFSYDGVKDLVELKGYFRLNGHLSVLGLISVSVEFYLELSYTSNGTVAGEAKLTIKVEILFFSTSVSISVRKEFAGSSGGGSAWMQLNDLDRIAALNGIGHGPYDGTCAALPEPMPRLAPPTTPIPIASLIGQGDWTEYCKAFA